MPVNFFLYSPTYQATVKSLVRERQASIVSYLTETYSPKEQKKLLIARLRDKQGLSVQKGNSPERYYADFRIYKKVHDDYLAVSEEERSEVIALAETNHVKEGERNQFLHAVWCFAQDGIRTMNDVMRLHTQHTLADAQSAPEPDAYAEAGEKPNALRAEELSASPLPETEAQTETVQTPTEAPTGDLPPCLLALFTQAPQQIAAITKIFEEMVDAFKRHCARLQQRLAEKTTEVEILKLQKKFLHELIENAGGTIVANIARLEEKTAKEQNTLRLIEAGIPQYTLARWWDAEYPMFCSDDFCERFFGDFLAMHEVTQTVKTLQYLAQDGPYDHGLQSKKWHKRVAGIPPDVRSYTYSRAADDLRIPWKKIEGKIYIFNINRRSEFD